jgi:hypothetical protein
MFAKRLSIPSDVRFHNKKVLTIKGDLCCAFECHDVDSVVSDTQSYSSRLSEEGLSIYQ